MTYVRSVSVNFEIIFYYTWKNNVKYIQSKSRKNNFFPRIIFFIMNFLSLHEFMIHPVRICNQKFQFWRNK